MEKHGKTHAEGKPLSRRQRTGIDIRPGVRPPAGPAAKMSVGRGFSAGSKGPVAPRAAGKTAGLTGLRSTFYAAWITALLIGMAIASVSLLIVWNHTSPGEVTRVYFEHPDTLPDKASLYETYRFSYAVSIYKGSGGENFLERAGLIRDERKEHRIKTESTLELYKMYDITGGTYYCLTRNIPKTPVKWVAENETNRKIISRFERKLDTDSYLPFVPMRTQILSASETRKGSASRYPWTEYTLEFSVTPYHPSGWVILRLESDSLSIIFDVAGEKTIVETSSETKEFEQGIMKKGTSHVKIEIAKEDGKEDGRKHARIVINNREAGTVLLPPEQDNSSSGREKGRIGADAPSGDTGTSHGTDGAASDAIVFKEIGTYASINALKAHVNSKFILSQKNSIIDYSIDQSVINSKEEELTRERKARLPLIRLPLEGSIYDEFSKIVGSEIAPDVNTSYLPSYWLVSTSNESQRITWNSFSISFSTADYGGSGEAGLMLVGQDGTPAWGFAMRRSTGDAFFFEYLNKTRVRLVYDSSVGQYAENNLKLVKNESSVLVYLNGRILFDQNLTLEQHINNKAGVNLTFFSEKSIMQFDRIVVRNLIPECGDALYFGECEKEYDVVQKFRPIVSRADKVTSVSVGDAGIGGAGSEAPPLDILEKARREALKRLTRVGNLNLGATPPKESSEANLSSYRFRNEFVMNLVNNNATNYNPVIPDETFEFNGPSARIAGWNNYEFKLRFVPLDGSRIISVSFRNSTGGDVVRFVLSVLNDRAYLVREGKTVTAEKRLSDSEEQTMGIIFENGAAYFEHNYKPLFTLTGVNMSTGYFVLETYNSYFDIRDMEVRNLNTRERKIFRAERDPCQLRLVGLKLLGRHELTLQRGEKKTFVESFTPEQDFDFGKVTVMVSDEAGINESIHFWVTRE